MTTHRRLLLRRSIAVAGSAALALSLLTTLPAVASAEDADADGIDLMIAPTGQAAPKAPKGKRAPSAGRAPSSSSSDFAAGATRRTARVATPSSPNDGTVVRTDVVQDLTAQRLRATVTFRHTTDNPVVYVYFGEFRGGTCEARAAIAGAANTGDTAGGFVGSSSSFGVTRSRSGAVMTLTSAAGSTFRAAEYDCAYVGVANSAGTALRQGFYAQDLVTQFTPRLAIQGGESLHAARRGKWVKTRLDIYNSGRADAVNTRVTAAGKGLQIKPRSRNLGRVNDRSTKYGVTFHVRVAKGTKARKINFTATANGVRTSKRFTVGVAPKPRKFASLSGRYFWGFATSSLSDSSGWDTEVIWFLNKRWAHIGAPKNGVVPKCRRTTKTCKKYTYNRKSGVMRLAGRKAKVTTYGFSYTAPKQKRRHFEPLTFPKKGQRIGANLINQDWSGQCVLMCTATTTYLTLDRKGRFVRTGFSVGSWPGLGSSWSSIPPDKRGTYRMISRGRIEMRFANGKVERRRIGLNHNALNRPSAASGVVLGDMNFYHYD